MRGIGEQWHWKNGAAEFQAAVIRTVSGRQVWCFNWSSYFEWQEMHPSRVAKVKQIILQLDSQDILILCLVISAQFFPYMGFFLLCFCNNLADCIVLHNKHYLQNVALFSNSWPIFKMLTYFKNVDPFTKCWVHMVQVGQNLKHHQQHLLFKWLNTENHDKTLKTKHKAI